MDSTFLMWSVVSFRGDGTVVVDFVYKSVDLVVVY